MNATRIDSSFPTPPKPIRLTRRWGFRNRGFFGGVILEPALLLTLLSTPLIREGMWSDSLIDLFAWLCFVGGVTFRFWATLYVGGRKRHTLVCHGPYSVCRNPLYLGSLLLALSAGFYLKSITFAAFLALAMLGYIFLTVPAEEKDLRLILGQPYEDYCRRVPRFWPRWNLFEAPPETTFKLHGLRLEARRALLWMLLPWCGEAFAHLRVLPWWPHLFLLP